MSDEVKDRFGDAPKRLSAAVQTIAEEGEDALREQLRDLESDDLRDLYLVACAALASYYQAHKLAVKRDQAAFDRTLGDDPTLH